MSGDNRPISEIFLAAAEEWVDLEAAASLLEDTKTSTMAQRQSELGDMPVNRAEQIVKASPSWMEYLNEINEARKKANRAKVQLDYIKMLANEDNNRQANQRAEMKIQ